MTRRFTQAAFVLAILGAFVSSLLAASVERSAQARPASSPSSAGSILPIVGDCPPTTIEPVQDARFAFEHRYEPCDLFGFVVCTTEPHFDATRARIRVTPTNGPAIDVVPNDLGEYEVRGLASGGGRIRCELDGYAPFEESFAFAAPGASARLDISMSSVRTVRVLLHDVHGARFSLDDRSKQKSVLNSEFDLAVLDAMPKLGRVVEDRELVPFRAASDHVDDAERAGQPWRELSASRATPIVVCLVRNSQVCAAVEVDGDSDETTLLVDLQKIVGRLEATIVDAETGSPLKGMTVLVDVDTRGMDAIVEFNDQWSLPWTSFTSDDEGQIRDAWLLAGSARVIVCSSERATFQTDIEITADKTTDLGVVRLARGVSVSGVALLPTGAPAVNRELHCWTDWSGDDWTRDFRVRFTDVNGQFLFESLKSGVYEIGEYVEQRDIGQLWFPDEFGYHRMGVGDASTVFTRADATRDSVKNILLTVVPPKPFRRRW